MFFKPKGFVAQNAADLFFMEGITELRFAGDFFLYVFQSIQNYTCIDF